MTGFSYRLGSVCYDELVNISYMGVPISIFLAAIMPNKEGKTLKYKDGAWAFLHCFHPDHREIIWTTNGFDLGSRNTGASIIEAQKTRQKSMEMLRSSLCVQSGTVQQPNVPLY